MNLVDSSCTINFCSLVEQQWIWPVLVYISIEFSKRQWMLTKVVATFQKVSNCLLISLTFLLRQMKFSCFPHMSHQYSGEERHHHHWLLAEIFDMHKHEFISNVILDEAGLDKTYWYPWNVVSIHCFLSRNTALSMILIHCWSPFKSIIKSLGIAMYWIQSGEFFNNSISFHLSCLGNMTIRLMQQLHQEFVLLCMTQCKSRLNFFEIHEHYLIFWPIVSNVGLNVCQDSTLLRYMEPDLSHRFWPPDFEYLKLNIMFQISKWWFYNFYFLLKLFQWTITLEILLFYAISTSSSPICPVSSFLLSQLLMEENTSPRITLIEPDISSFTANTSLDH